jgi:hypothetical protein
MLPLIVFYIIFLWFRYRKIRYVEYLLLGLIIPALYLIYFVITKGIISDFFYWTVTFNVTVFAQMGRKYFTFSEMLKVLPIFGTTIIILLVECRKNTRRYFSSIFGILTIFFIGSLFFSYARQDYVHLQPALGVALLIICYWLSEHRSKGRNIVAMFLILLSVLFGYRAYINLHSDKVMFYSDEEEKVAHRVIDLTNPGNKIFAFGTLPNIYQMTFTMPSGNLFVFQFPWFMRQSEDRILKAVEADPPKLIIRDSTAIVSGINLTGYMSRIGNFVNKYYHVSERIGAVEIMLPN